uniref:Uncharacterized protein n=1 Tax=Rhizophagus irregularis (strain DAOM 181602 / DAOM 197198 / MUCL 43194) TaxID=747089 RepID=U9U1V2_RHIID
MKSYPNDLFSEYPRITDISVHFSVGYPVNMIYFAYFSGEEIGFEIFLSAANN